MSYVVTPGKCSIRLPLYPSSERDMTRCSVAITPVFARLILRRLTSVTSVTSFATRTQNSEDANARRRRKKTLSGG